MKRFLVCLLAVYSLLFAGTLCAQNDIPDTILMNNGKVILSHVIDTIGYSIQITKPHRHKKIELDKEDIFQITFGSSGKTVVLYFYDTLIGNDMTVDDARRFIAGEQDAEHGYHAFGTSAASFAVGCASGIVGSFFALAPPFAFAGFMSYNYVKIRHKSVKHVENVHHDSYLYGYALVARRKRTLRSLLWGGIGVSVGTFMHYAIFKAQ